MATAKTRTRTRTQQAAQTSAKRSPRKPAPQPATPTRQQVLAEFRRSEILAAAVAVFAREGYAEARMDEIARQASLAKGTLYLYFRSKDEVYAAAVRQALDELQALTATAVDNASDLRARIEAIISVRVRFWEQKTDLYRIILSLGRDDTRQARRHEWLRESVLSIARMLSAETTDPRIPRRVADAVAWAILDLIRGVTERRLYTGRPLSGADIAFLVNFILLGLGSVSTRATPKPR